MHEFCINIFKCIVCIYIRFSFFSFLPRATTATAAIKVSLTFKIYFILLSLHLTHFPWEFSEANIKLCIWCRIFFIIPPFLPITYFSISSKRKNKSFLCIKKYFQPLFIAITIIRRVWCVKIKGDVRAIIK